MYIHSLLAIYSYIATMSSLHIWHDFMHNIVVPSKNYFFLQVCVAVTPYIFGCSSMFIKISVANIS